jgi:hypothetical protein
VAPLQLVEIHGTHNSATNEFTATRVDIEDLEDDEFEPENNGEFEVEGFVSGCPVNDTCGSSFFVGGRPVTMTTNRFENGNADDLRNGVRVEADGHYVTSSGTLLADKIKFKRIRVELTGDATIDGGGNLVKGGSLTIMGITVLTNDVTEIDTKDSITDERLEIRGYIDASGQAVAEKVKDEPGGGGDDIVRGLVTAEVGTTLTIAGISVSVATATQFEDAQDQPILGPNARDIFLDLVTPGTTAVKAEGSFAGGTLTAKKAEIED